VKTILVVDDEKDICFFLKANLELTGKYKVVVETSPKNAFHAAATCKPALILLDIMMPVMDGFEVLKRLKANDATMNIPVAMLTGQGDQKSQERALGLFNEDYIIKPVNMTDLMARIDAILSRTR